jgi:hypothetical protein
MRERMLRKWRPCDPTFAALVLQPQIVIAQNDGSQRVAFQPPPPPLMVDQTPPPLPPVPVPLDGEAE